MQDLDTIKKAAIEASKIALSYSDKNFKTWDKDAGAGPVTEVDIEIDNFLRTFLLKCEPDYGWLSEETEDNTARLGKSKVFIVDPIDGTRSFIAGDKTWAHSIAVAEKGKPIAAVVYLPRMDLLYTAEIGNGAFLNGEKITVSEVCDLMDAKILAKKSVFEKENWKNGQSNILRQRYRPSLAYRLALVAEGSYDAMITLGKSWEGDICAGHLLVTEAGGSVTTSHGSDINYNSSTGSSQGIIAGNAIVRKAISAQLNL